MKIILDEIELKEKALSDGYISDKPTDTIRVLIKHYFSEGLKKAEVKKKIEEFLGNKKYDPLKWDKTIKSMVNGISKKSHTLYKVESVQITKDELNTIGTLDNIDHQKLAYVMLVIAKVKNKIRESDETKNHEQLEKSRNWINTSNRELFKEAKVKVNRNEHPIRELMERGLVKATFKVDGEGLQVCFVNEDSEDAIIITDFRDFVYTYEQFKGAKMKNCELCKRLIRDTVVNKMYCIDCGKKVKNDKNKEYYHLGKRQK